MSSLITVKHKGSFKNTEEFFHRSLRRDYMKVIHKYGEMGVEQLRLATPKDSGVTAESWKYHIEEGPGTTTIVWTNSSQNQGFNIAILLIYGHGLQDGGYVQGDNFVSPALREIMNTMAIQVWREVTK